MSPSAELEYQGMSLSIRNTFLHLAAEEDACQGGRDDQDDQPTLSRARTAPLQGAAGAGAGDACSPAAVGKAGRQKTASFMDTVEEVYADDTTEDSEGREAPSRDETTPEEEDDAEEWIPPLQHCVTRDSFDSPLASWDDADAAGPPGGGARADCMWPAGTLDGFSVQWDWLQQHQLHGAGMHAPMMMVPAMFQGVAQIALSPAEPMPASAAPFAEAASCVLQEAWSTGTEPTVTACVGQAAREDCRTEAQSQATSSAPSQSARSGPSDAKPRAAGRQAQLPRTTVMLRNLPNNYTRDGLLDLIDAQGFAGRYDFLYFPIDFRTHAALGYAFLNLATPEDAEEFHRCVNGFSQWSLPSSKVCSVGWSHPHQGLEAHIARYRNSPLMHESVPDSYRPVLFAEGLRVPFSPPTKRVKPPRQGTERMLV